MDITISKIFNLIKILNLDCEINKIKKLQITNNKRSLYARPINFFAYFCGLIRILSEYNAPTVNPDKKTNPMVT
jgi:hypothetical protein